MVSARLAIPLAAIACLAGAALLFPSVTENAWQALSKLTGLASTDADAQDSGVSPKGAASGRGATGPIPVTIARAEKAPFPIIVRTFGTVQSPAVVVVGARISSQVAGIHVKDGQMVKAGDLLISLDDRVVLAQLARDRAVLAKDRALVVSTTADLNRAKDLLAKGAGTAQTYDAALAAQQSAQATVDADQATVDADQLQVDFTKITAPIDGRLGAVQVSVGDLVGGSSASASGGTTAAGLVTVTQVDPIQVIFHLPEDNLQVFKAMLDAGRPPVVKALLSGTTDLIASGKLDFIDSSVDAASGTITMRAVFGNDKASLWPGQYVDLEVDQGVIADATVIPTVAIQPGQDGQFVYVVKPDNTIELRPTEIARSDGDMSAVSSGLTPGDAVVTEGQQRLKPGVTVTPSPAATAQAGQGRSK
jgi:membrane fusion protein, multidrug efflux system